jgi:YggT family protein
MGKGSGAVKRGTGECKALLWRRNRWPNIGGQARRPSLRIAKARATVARISLSAESRMRAILWLINTIITIYVWLLIAQAVLSWLLAFGVINRYNRTVSVIGDFLYRVTEPALRPIRARLPNFGGIDISPVVLILILYFLRILIDEDLAPVLLGIAP